MCTMYGMEEREWDESEEDHLPPEAFCPREDCGGVLETFTDKLDGGYSQIYSICKECKENYAHR